MTDVTTRIPLAGPWITQKEIDAVADAAAHAWYEEAYRYHQRFEEAFAGYVGMPFAVALPSCTSAIHLALVALGIGPGDEVIVPEITWIASAAPIVYVGATPVFADIDPKTWCLSAESLEACVTSRTKAVIPVDLYGNLPDMDALHNVARRHGLTVIEDAAEAIGAEYQGRKAGSLGDIGVFSFHGSKTLTTGEGGMLLTNRQDLYERVKVLQDHGRRPGDKSYRVEEVAYKYQMSGLQAALGLAQLERIEELLSRKHEVFEWYRRHLDGVEGVSLNYEAPGTTSSYWLVTAVLDRNVWDMPKERVIERMNQQQIDCRAFFHPLSSLPAFAHTEQARLAQRRNRISYAISPYGINLPSALNLTDDAVARVCRTFREILKDGVPSPRPVRTVRPASAEPAAAPRVPMYRPLVEREEFQAAQEALKMGWLGMGSCVAEFEQAIARYVGASDQHVAAVSTGYAALHLGLLLAGVGPGDEVITPSFNNVADFQAVLATGAELVLCDIDETTLCIDLQKAAELITPKTKVVIVMDYACMLADHDGAAALARRRGVRILHDAAHSFGSTYHGKRVGSFSDLCAFSFDPIKNITCIDGGALIVRTRDELERIQEMRLIGMQQSSATMYKNQRAWTYDVRTIGFRYHLANLHAAIGLAQLKKMPRITASRRSAAQELNARLGPLAGVTVPHTDFQEVTPFLYYVRVAESRREAFREHLHARGVETGIHWQPGHWLTRFKPCRRGDLSVTDRVGKEIVSLPLHACMAQETLDRIVEAVTSFVAS